MIDVPGSGNTHSLSGGSATVLKINSSVLPPTAPAALRLIQSAPVKAGEIFPTRALHFNLHPQPCRLPFPLKGEAGIMALMKAAARL